MKRRLWPGSANALLFFLALGGVTAHEPSGGFDSREALTGFDSKISPACQAAAGTREAANLVAWESLGDPFSPAGQSSPQYAAEGGFVGVLVGIYGNPLDLNVDSWVNERDLLVFPNGWLRSRGEFGYRTRADRDGDDTLDQEDMVEYLRLFRRRK